jgi:hypothetical protein
MCALPKPHAAATSGAEATLPLFYREERLRLSPTALELLLSRADVWVEGSVVTKGSAKGRFLGSAMLTLDLAAAADRLRPPRDADAADRLFRVVQDDKAVRKRIAAHALATARTRLSPPHDLVVGEWSAKVDGTRVLIDMELGSP